MRGQEITDIDAAGTLASRLVLVSCKSWPFTRAYDRGEYRTIRNTMERAIAAVDEWSERVSIIKSNPIDDNYDVSGFSDIVGVVVLPFRPFVPMGKATLDVLPGLPAVVGVGELETWLTEPAATLDT